MLKMAIFSVTFQNFSVTGMLRIQNKKTEARSRYRYRYQDYIKHSVVRVRYMQVYQGFEKRY